MTTVVCDKNEMACDLQFTEAGYVKWKGKTKIYKFKANPLTYPHCDFLMGFAGNANDLVTVAEFFSVPENFPKGAPNIKGLTGLVLTEEGNIYSFTHPAKWLLMGQPYAAIGSGSPFALGAMASGASPKEAVKVATKHDAFTGMGVKTLKFN